MELVLGNVMSVTGLVVLVAVAVALVRQRTRSQATRDAVLRRLDRLTEVYRDDEAA